MLFRILFEVLQFYNNMSKCGVLCLILLDIHSTLFAISLYSKTLFHIFRFPTSLSNILGISSELSL